MTTLGHDTYYVFLREMKRLARQRSRILMAVVQPMIWLVLMGNMMSGLTSNPFAARMLGTGSYLDFMTPGIMLMSSLFGGVFGGVSIIWDRRTGYLNRMLAAPMARAAIPLGKMAGIAVQNIFQSLVITAVALALGVHFAAGLAGMLLILFLISLFSAGVAGISLSLATVIRSHEALMAVTNFLTLPMMFASNAIFPREAMPSWLRVIADVNPLTYAVTPVRALIVDGWAWENILPGVAFTVLFALAMIVVAARQFSRAAG